MSSSTTSMHNTLRDALVIKAMDLLAANLVLEQRRTVVFTARADHPKPSGYASQLMHRNRLGGTHQLSVSDTLTPWSVVKCSPGRGSWMSCCRSTTLSVEVAAVKAFFADSAREDMAGGQKWLPSLRLI